MKNDYTRLRSKTIAFRVTPIEESQIRTAIALSGLTKQEYITNKLLDKTIYVQGNCKIHRAVYDLLQETLSELKRINEISEPNLLLLSNLEHMLQIIDTLYVKKSS